MHEKEDEFAVTANDRTIHYQTLLPRLLPRPCLFIGKIICIFYFFVEELNRIQFKSLRERDWWFVCLFIPLSSNKRNQRKEQTLLHGGAEFAPF